MTDRPQTTEHDWIYVGTDGQRCLRCGLLASEAPLASGGSQAYAPCAGPHQSQTTERVPKVSPSERDLRRAAEMEEWIIARIKEGLTSIGLPHVNSAPKKLAEYIAMHLTEVRAEGAIEAHQLWQSGALPAFAEGADEK